MEPIRRLLACLDALCGLARRRNEAVRRRPSGPVSVFFPVARQWTLLLLVGCVQDFDW